jgi:hypothetical protein
MLQVGIVTQEHYDCLDCEKETYNVTKITR